MRLLAIALGLCACQGASSGKLPTCWQRPESDNLEIARVGQESITYDQILARLKKQTSPKANRELNLSELRQIIEDEIRFELLAQAACDRGLYSDPEVVDTARQVMVRKLLQRDLDPSRQREQITSQQVANYYSNHKHEYHQPEKRRLAHIQLPLTDDGRLLAENLAWRLSTGAENPNTFANLVKNYSTDLLSRDQEGELAYKTQSELYEEFGLDFAEAIFSLPVGPVANSPIESIHGWHVIKVLAQREALTRNLTEVENEIRDRLRQKDSVKSFADYLSELEKRHPIALHESRLDQVLKQLTETTVSKPAAEIP